MNTKFSKEDFSDLESKIDDILNDEVKIDDDFSLDDAKLQVEDAVSTAVREAFRDVSEPEVDTGNATREILKEFKAWLETAKEEETEVSDLLKEINDEVLQASDHLQNILRAITKYKEKV